MRKYSTHAAYVGKRLNLIMLYKLQGEKKMATSQEKLQQYRSKWLKIQNFIRNNTGYKIAGVARAGSIKQGGWTLDSDLDIRFAIAKFFHFSV